MTQELTEQWYAVFLFFLIVIMASRLPDRLVVYCDQSYHPRQLGGDPHLFSHLPCELAVCSQQWEDPPVSPLPTDEEGTWGSQTEMYVLAHMTGLNISSFNTWARMYAYILPGHIDQEQYPDDLTRPAIYIQYTGNHFNVTLSQGSWFLSLHQLSTPSSF